MITIEADIKRNLLLVQAKGVLTDYELKIISDTIIVELSKLKKGYTIINDITILNPVSAIGAKEFKRVQALVQNEVGLVIRVINDPIIALQFQKVSMEMSYRVIEVKTLDQAFKIVDDGLSNNS